MVGAGILLLGAGSAAAQYAKADPLLLPEFSQVDSQGVDLSTGIIETSLPGVSIGVAERAMKYELKSKGGYFFTNNLNMNDNWSIFLVTGVPCSRSGSPRTSCVTLDLPGRSATFDWTGSSFVRQYGGGTASQAPDRLVRSGSSYVYTTKEGDVYTFTTSVIFNGGSNILHNTFYPNGRVYILDSLRRSNGESINIFYKSFGYYIRKQAVVSSLGYMLKYIYSAPITAVGNGSNYAAISPSAVMAINQAWDYCDPSADACALNYNWPTTSLTYNSATSVSVTSTDMATIGVTTDANYLPTKIIGPSITRSINYVFSVSHRSAAAYLSPVNNVRTVSDNGRSWTYNLSSLQGGQTLLRTNNMIVTDPLSGNAGMLTYYYATSTNMYWTPPGRQQGQPQASQAKEYNFKGDEISFSDFEGNRLSFVPDGRGNRLSVTLHPKVQSGLSPIQAASDFDTSCLAPAKCNQPNWSIDSNGARTDYEYDASTGLPTRISQPAGSDGIRPVTRRYYTQRYAWLKNAQGGFSPSSSAVTVLAQEKTCRATATLGDGCAGGTGDEVTISYDYGVDAGPNNLWLRGVATSADGQVLRTCYGYDRVGNRISETTPNAGLAGCSQ